MAKMKKEAMDGAMAAAYAGYAFTEVAGIYPITPSTNLAEWTDQWASEGKKNMFGQTVQVVEMQSEAGAAGAVHGSLQAGALSTTYTASQGLLLKIPNMYKIAGELLPGVIHVTARTVATHALSIFGDHSDVMATRQTGFAMLASANVQETMDLAAVAHLSAIKGRVPFTHFFDGFRTSQEIQKVDALNYEDLYELVDKEAIEEFRKRALNPITPVLRGAAQNPDTFFQARESSNPYYNAVPGIVEHYMEEINKITGRNYSLFQYHGHPEAEHVVIAMGSVCDTLEETVDYLTAKGKKVGMLKVRLYRPFVIDRFLDAIPESVTKISVLDRTKEPGALGEPLYQDVCTAYFPKAKRPLIVGGRYGLSSKDVTPAQLIAVFTNLEQAEPKNGFTVGINDDVTFTSLPVGEEIDITPEGTFGAKIWGLGSDGTVGANKNTIKIISDTTDNEVQAYFSYDSKKSGGITQSHLRFGKAKIRAPYFVKSPDFIACHRQVYLYKYEVLEGLKPGGTFLLNTIWKEGELEAHLPGKVKRYLAQNKINFYTIDATHIAETLGLGNRTNTVLQSAFFKLTNIIPIEDAVREMKTAIEKTYGRRGQDVLDMNYSAVDQGKDNIVKINVPESWANAPLEDEKAPDVPKNISDKNIPIDTLKGDLLPVSTFVGVEDGTWLPASSQYEKRAVADNVPVWIKENCIQCNLCSYYCPHATIRPFLSTEEEASKGPESFETIPGVAKQKDYKFSIVVNQLDCQGCALCVVECPGKKGQKALEMKPLEEETPKFPAWEYALSLSEKPNPVGIGTVAGTQFERPLLEYSGACAGCGETPYAKLITQLYGDSMVIGNATGCSSIWGGSAPSTPYAVNSKGRGPAWANSLFEDTAEFTYGMVLGDLKIKEALVMKGDKLAELTNDGELKSALKDWIDTITDTLKSKEATAVLIEKLEKANLTGEADELRKELLTRKNNLQKVSYWAFGGDGWAYDIGFGGLDHVIATGADINMMVFDTEVYSNTGGQSSKASPVGSIAKLTAAGKNTAKKDLGLIAMSYGNVYVTQIGMGANMKQTLDAIKEAEAYPGPSVIIAYSPCIAHGIKGGMANSQKQIKAAVAAGYWHLYRYNPTLREEGKNPFILDSKEPTESVSDFLSTETRYSSLKRFYPDRAERLYEEAEKHAKRKWLEFKRLSEYSL
ncbi:MAG: pyruvate:ferredoxin (flavodoxin) oxidoreductase [Defluviitaleaceae bacterium]|nr:pyruvate:ferredoxin (flavodoxin) oxidoreductase [Defluviitaleaceae bacterium]